MKIYTPPIDLSSFVTSSQLSAQFAEKAAGESILPIPQPQSPPAGVIITASSSVNGYGPEKAFDGLLSGQNFWAHSFTAPTVQSPAVLTIEYLEPVFIEGYSIVRYGIATQSPVSWFVETSVDGITWVLRKTVANEPVSTARINEYWNRPLRPERFIRLTITDVGAFNPGGNFAGVYEFKGIQNPASLLDSSNTGSLDFLSVSAATNALWVDAGQPCYTTQTLTTVATTDGQTVLNIPDQSFSGGGALTNTANGATYRLVSGVPVWEFANGRRLTRTFTSRTVTDFVFAATFRIPGTPNFFQLLGMGTAGSTSDPFISPRWTVGEYRLQGIVPANVGGLGHVFSDDWYTLIVTSTASRVRVYLNGVEVTASQNGWVAEIAGNASFASTGHHLGNDNGAGVQIAELFMIESALPQSVTPQTIHNYFVRKRPALFPNKQRVLWVGNSISTMNFVNFSAALPQLVYAGRAKQYYLVNSSRGGANHRTWLTRFSELSGFVDGNTTVFLWEGRNELVGLNNTVLEVDKAATAFSTLTVLVGQLLSLGVRRIVIGTVLPSNSLQNATRNAYNTLIRNYVTENPTTTALCDFAANATMGADGANANATNYLDGIHPSATGNAILSPIAIAALESVLT